MEAIVSAGHMQPLVLSMVQNSEWMKTFPAEMARTHKLLMMTVKRPNDNKFVDVVGVIDKAYLEPFDLAQDFEGKPAPSRTVPAWQLLGNMERGCMFLHHRELKASPLDTADTKEIDFVDFKAAALGVKDFATKTTLDTRDKARLVDQVVAFLSTGKLPIIIATT